MRRLVSFNLLLNIPVDLQPAMFDVALLKLSALLSYKVPIVYLHTYIVPELTSMTKRWMPNNGILNPTGTEDVSGIRVGRIGKITPRSKR